MKIVSVVGARPNFMKLAPFARAIAAFNVRRQAQNETLIEHYLIHTGQHYDEPMSASFFDELAIPRPDTDLGVGSGSHAQQVGATMIAFETVVRDLQPDWVVVVGDVNATCACSITAKKEHLKLAHIEAGLRSFDLDMPEEINRMVTDRLSDLLFAPDDIAVENLRKEGVAEDKIKLVGNIMIDTLEAQRAGAAQLDVATILARNKLADSDAKLPGAALKPEGYALMTLHRPSNVDDREVLEPLMRFVRTELAADVPVIWPIHPRARKQLEMFGLWESIHRCSGLLVVEPLSYRELLKLNMHARIMLTDSGGLQEECCVLGTPCLTLRWNTERPVTLTDFGGVSMLVGNDVSRIRAGYASLRQRGRHPSRPPLWDGKTTERIVRELVEAG